MEFQLLLASIHSSPRSIEPLCVGGKGERERHACTCICTCTCKCDMYVVADTLDRALLTPSISDLHLSYLA